MNRLRESRRAAMNVEEAALLPALPRSYPAGSAALWETLDAAQRIGEKRLSNAVDVNASIPARQPLHPRSRAALHHVLRR